jgi:hypothetical protein
MGWRINLVKNDLPLTQSMEDDINKLHNGESAANGKLVFKSSHLEWMDYVWRDEVHDILSKGKATGEVLFSSSEGDNAGKTWGYRYTDGALTKLVRHGDEWVPEGSVSEEDLEFKETGNEPTDLGQAQRGDSVAVGFIYAGLTSYERSVIGDILPDGALVVDGREFKAPTYRFNDSSGIGGSFVLKTIDNVPAEEFE